MTRRTNGVFRPDMTSHYEMISSLRDGINETALYGMSDTDICKIAVEKMFSRMFPEKSVVSKRRKTYIQVKY
jgi:hypothetical protein